MLALLVSSLCPMLVHCVMKMTGGGGARQLKHICQPLTRATLCREANVLSHISLAAPLAGAVPAVNVRTSGNGFLLPDNPLFTLLGPAIPFLVYPAFMGLPSPVLLFPYASAFGADSVG